MRKFSFILLLAALLLLGVSLVAHAQENPSAFDPDYNWCDPGEPWGDGRCNNFTDPDMIHCHWRMGWFLPRALAGEFRLVDVASPCMTVVQELSNGCVILVVVLQGSPYAGVAHINVAADDFDGSLLGMYCGLEIHGNDNDNLILGSPGNDIIYGYGGMDIIIGDTICGNGYGDDFIDGGDGDDMIIGDTFCGDGYGNDTIYGGAGTDVIIGDTLLGNGYGDDTIYGGDDDDMITGDTVCGDGYGNDTIYGEGGDDTIMGDSECGDGYGNDVINGGDGDDDIAGDSYSGNGYGDDVIDGGADYDYNSGAGNTGDTVTNIEDDTSTPDS